MRSLLLGLLVLCAYSKDTRGQKIVILDSIGSTSIRGLSVVNNNVLWASGSSGRIGRSVNGGKSFFWVTVPGYEKTDFRDIEAFDSNKAVIMGIDTPAVILKTSDGGKTWKLVYENKRKGMFLDAMHFWNEESGIVIGDPVLGRFFIIRTFDGGEKWQELPLEKLPKADSGEACFAASGTNIRSLDKSEACFVSGGLKSRFFWKGDPVSLPLLQGKATTGANSIAVRNPKKRKGSKYLAVVGGDFANDTATTGNCVLSRDGGQSWFVPAIPPHGYRSCVEYITNNKMIACGTSGVDLSENGGNNWRLISPAGFHVCRKAKKGKAVFLAGSHGRIAKLVW